MGMALVDRYLNAVKFWLPRDQKNDIIAELAEDLRAQIEEKESELGHQLSDAEIEPILKKCGSPMLVAERYLPQRALIGPVLFPIYRVVIRSLILYFLLPWFLIWLGTTIFSPDFRIDHPGVALLVSLEPWWLACIHSLFFCTLAFALLDRSQARAQIVNGWNPRALPAEHDGNKISRGSTVFELTISIASLVLWFELGAFHRVFHLLGMTVTLSAAWPYYFWALMVLSVAIMGVACLNLTTPRWTRLSASLRLGLDCYLWVLAYWLCRNWPVQSLTAADLSPAVAAGKIAAINQILSSWAIWVALIGAIVLAFDVRRILRVEREASAPLSGSARHVTSANGIL